MPPGRPSAAPDAADNASKLANYAWIEPPPNSPLAADMKSILIAIGAERIRIVFSGGGLKVINYLMHSDSLAALPHTVVFGMRHQKTITALSYSVPHPARNRPVARPGPGAHAAPRWFYGSCRRASTI